MKSQAIISVLMWTVAVGSIAMPFVVRRHFQAELAQCAEAFRAREAVLEHPDREKATRSSVAARAVALSSEELSELLRLRAEIGLLREQTNLIEQLKQENAQRNSEQQIQAAKSQSQLAEELSADTVACMEAVLKELPSACARFAADHEGKAPSAFHELRIYFTRDGHPLTGIFSFEFVREAGPKPGDTLILREVSSHFRDGKAVRVYGFADGTAKEMIFSDQEQEGREQIRWEHAQLGLPERTFDGNILSPQ